MKRKTVTRKEALAGELKRFFNGNPCKYGHVSERITSNSACVKCREILRNDPEYKKARKKYDEKYRATNFSRDSIKRKKYREKNKEKISDARKVHYHKNKEKILSKAREYKNSPANYKTLAPQAIGYDCKETKEGKLSLRCKHCDKWFTPKTSAVMSRISSINGRGRTLGSENHLYCSEKCKDDCDLFYAVSIPKSERGKVKRKRCHQSTNRKALLENQIDKYSHNFCEKCGTKTTTLHIHHSLLVSENHNEADNMAHQILLCSKCHKKPETHCRD